MIIRDQLILAQQMSCQSQWCPNKLKNQSGQAKKYNDQLQNISFFKVVGVKKSPIKNLSKLNKILLFYLGMHSELRMLKNNHLYYSSFVL